MIDRDDLIAHFDDSDNAGVLGNAELAELLDEPEQFVRREGRLRGIRRVGSVMVWSVDDALELYDDIVEEDDEEDDLDDLDDDE